MLHDRRHLEAGRILFDIGATIDYTWFIISGIVLLLGVTKDGGPVELAMAWCDSVIGFTEIVRKNRAVFRS